MAEFDTSSYPRPQPPTNPLDVITKFGQVADVMGNVEAGKAVQGAIDPTSGEIDRNKLAQALRGSVAGGMKALPTLNAYEQLRNAGHVADQSGLETFQKRMALVNHLFGQLASKEAPTIQDVHSIAARVLDPSINGPKYGVTFPVVMNAIKTFRGPDGRPLTPAQIKQKALDMQTMTAETATQLEAHSPRFQVVDDGNTIRFEPVGTRVSPEFPAITKRIPTGTPVIPPGSFVPQLVPPQPTAPSSRMPDRDTVPDNYSNNFGGVITGVERKDLPPVVPGAAPAAPKDSFSDRFAPVMRGAPATALMPGTAGALEKTAGASADFGNQLTAAANEVPAVRGILNNLDRTVSDFTPGPGADYARIAKSFANTVLPESWQKPGSILDPKRIASQEEFNKFAYQLAQQQFQQLGGTGTDSKLASTMATSPSELLSKYGNKGIIQILKGNNDALSTKASEWNKWRKQNGPESYADFINDFNQHFDPRVFQFKYVPRGERQSWYKAMSPEERRSFEEAASYALAKGWIKAK